MAEFLTHHRKKLFIVFLISVLLMVGLCAQLGFLMIARSDHYSKMADELHKRERTIKAARGEIVDRNGTVIAANLFLLQGFLLLQGTSFAKVLHLLYL